MPTDPPAPRARQIAAAVIGNALEWYDFIIFGNLTVVISRLFFPAESQYVSLLRATATFGVGFFMRPIGGILLGIYADRKGRKAALQLIISVMTIAIAMIALAPPYAVIGVAAPVIIVAARLLQGFATGGEFASATAFLVETGLPRRRGFYGSWQMVGQGLAVLVGAILGALLTQNLAPESFNSWGWRVPFLFGLLIGPVGLYIRRHLEETRAFLESREEPKKTFGLAPILAAHAKPALACAGIVTAGTISFYVILLYMPTFASTQLGIALGQAFTAQALGLVCMIVVTPLFGALSDHIGRKPIMIGALAIYLIFLYPLFLWVYMNPSFWSLMIVQIVFCILLGAFIGPFSTAMAEQFPARTRSTAMAVPYNVAVMGFGGFAQFFVTWLINATGSPIAPAFYVMFGAAVGLVAAFFLVEQRGDGTSLLAER
jgi:MFS transporter, MHS family, proline/betaine transporter